jgi:predicted ATP-grasp superfamily ATP-dependent carboligase
MDLVRPLALAGIRSVVVAPPDAPPRWSRFARETLRWHDPWEKPEALVDELLAWGRAQPDRVPLFYEEDRDLVAISRARDRLATSFSFVLPPSGVVEDLVDKARFAAYAERLGLPTPPARRLAPGEDDVGGLRFPLVVKPLTRRGFDRWQAVAGGAKAALVATPRELAPFAAAELELLAQEAVPGPETRIESYHCYVDAAGSLVAEFTGRKIRTRPAANGFSTALELTGAEDVARLGRELVRRMELVGIAKLDFKRRDDGSLALLEVNPRFNLWHHLGAVAGVNLPALVYADLVDRPRPRIARARPGATWCFHLYDALAAREQGVGLGEWLRFAARADALSTFAWDDPLPFAVGVAWRGVRSKLAR